MKRYYSILRPVSIGTFPKKGAVSIRNFDSRQYIESIHHEAWGYIEYLDTELTDQECRQYDLIEEDISVCP